MGRQKAGLITPFVLEHFQTDFPEKQSQGEDVTNTTKYKKIQQNTKKYKKMQ